MKQRRGGVIITTFFFNTFYSSSYDFTNQHTQKELVDTPGTCSVDDYFFGGEKALEWFD